VNIPHRYVAGFCGAPSRLHLVENRGSIESPGLERVSLSLNFVHYPLLRHRPPKITPAGNLRRLSLRRRASGAAAFARTDGSCEAETVEAPGGCPSEQTGAVLSTGSSSGAAKPSETDPVQRRQSDV
jgi:hypothetical protein